MSDAIIKLSSLGDIIHLALLLPMFQKREITWFVDEIFSEILNHSPYISHIYPLPIKKLTQQKDWKGIYRCLKQLKKLPSYTQIIDAQGLIKSGLITHYLSADTKIGFSYSSAKEGLCAFFYHQHCHIDYNEHILHRNAKLLSQAYHIPYDTQKLELYLQQRRTQNLIALDASITAKEKIKRLLLHDDIKILFALEASKPNKIYPKEQFLRLAQLLQKPGRKIYLLWHDQEIIAHEMAQINTDLVCLPRLSLDEVKALLLQMNLVIGGDTGIVHLAFALNIPSITLFGNTPIERFALLSPFNQAIRAKESKNYDKNDFSITTLSPNKIADIAEEIFLKVHNEP